MQWNAQRWTVTVENSIKVKNKFPRFPVDPRASSHRNAIQRIKTRLDNWWLAIAPSELPNAKLFTELVGEKPIKVVDKSASRPWISLRSKSTPNFQPRPIPQLGVCYTLRVSALSYVINYL